ncbi:MAG: hypothetical protein NW216_09605 [Hyphomicrobium sp.]|nr:hypothetical protein [Hyphomicrobium sp.]
MKIEIPRIAIPSGRLVLAAVFSIAILHILLTFAAPAMTAWTPYGRLAAKLPLNRMTLLPPIGPRAQPLPFVGSDFRLAMCRFDTEEGPVALNATLPAQGWTISIYDADGATIYSAIADPGRRVDVALLIVPDDERFAGLTPEARGDSAVDSGVLRVAATSGIAILRAPDSGLAYRARNEDELKRATCRVGRS